MIAKFKEHDPENYIILLSLSPCKLCTKILINAGFKHVYWLEDYRETKHFQIFDQCNITYGTLDSLLDDYHPYQGVNIYKKVDPIDIRSYYI